MIEAWERGRGVEVLNLFGSNEGLVLYACPDTIPDPADRGRFFPRPGDRRSFNWRTRIGLDTRSRLVDLETGDDITEAGRPGEFEVVADGLSRLLGGRLSPFDEFGFYRSGDIFEIAGEGGTSARLRRSSQRTSLVEVATRSLRSRSNRSCQLTPRFARWQ